MLFSLNLSGDFFVNVRPNDNYPYCPSLPGRRRHLAKNANASSISLCCSACLTRFCEGGMCAWFCFVIFCDQVDQ